MKLLPDVTLTGDLRQSVFYPLFRYGCYPHQLGADRIARTILRPGDVVYDVGANIGYTAVLYAEAVQKAGHVYAFEPSWKSLSYLRENTRPWDNITVVPAAVSDSREELTFAEREQLDRSGVLPGTEEKDRDSRSKPTLYAVKATTLDDFCQASGRGSPRFLKVDVEGHEEKVFEGAAELLRRGEPIVMFEALDDRSARRNLKALEELSGGKYEFARVTLNGELVAADSTGSNVTSDFFAIPRWGLHRFLENPRRGLSQ